MKFDKVYALGDIHANFGVIADIEVENSLIIQVGDFGAGLDNNRDYILLLQEINEILKSKNNTMFVIRGNHDNPSFFKGQHKYSNIELLQDYTVCEINGERYLFVGGALSINRKQKINRGANTYWTDEVFNLDIEKLETIGYVDRIITHTTTSFAPPNTFNEVVRDYMAFDTSLEVDLLNERELVGEMFNKLCMFGTPKSFIYGHFHQNSRFHHNGTDFICVDINNLLLISESND